jgi:hypothetical protein
MIDLTKQLEACEEDKTALLAWQAKVEESTRLRVEERTKRRSTHAASLVAAIEGSLLSTSVGGVAEKEEQGRMGEQGREEEEEDDDEQRWQMAQAAQRRRVTELIEGERR